MIKRLFFALLFAPMLGHASPERVPAIDDAVNKAEWKTAVKLAEAWVDESPNDALAHYWLAVALRTKMEEVNRLRAMGVLGDYKDALARSIELDPTMTEPRAEQIGFLIHAPGIAGGDREEAAEKIAVLEEIDPAAAARMAVELAQIEEDPEALKRAIDKLLLVEPEGPEQAFQTAMLLLGQERFVEAEERLVGLTDAEEPGIALGATYQRARWRIIAEQEIDTAIALLEEYLAQRGDSEVSWAPDRAAAFWRLGLAQELSGDKEAALASLEESVSLNPDFDPAKKDLRRVKRGR